MEENNRFVPLKSHIKHEKLPVLSLFPSLHEKYRFQKIDVNLH